MTIKELYELAKAQGKENLPLTVYYRPDDDWYTLNSSISEDNVRFYNDEISLEF